MQITINIEKKHVYTLIIALVVFASILVVMASVPEGTSFHEILYTDRISEATTGEVIVEDPLTAADGLTVQNGATIDTATIDSATIGAAAIATISSTLLTLNGDLAVNRNAVVRGNTTLTDIVFGLPSIINNYSYIRFLDANFTGQQIGGIMYNHQNPNYGSTDSLVIYTYTNPETGGVGRDIVLKPSSGVNLNGEVVVTTGLRTPWLRVEGNTFVDGFLTVRGEVSMFTPRPGPGYGLGYFGLDIKHDTEDQGPGTYRDAFADCYNRGGMLPTFNHYHHNTVWNGQNRYYWTSSTAANGNPASAKITADGAYVGGSWDDKMATDATVYWRCMGK